MLTREQTALTSLFQTIDNLIASLQCPCFDADVAVHYAAMSVGMSVPDFEEAVKQRKKFAKNKP